MFWFLNNSPDYSGEYSAVDVAQYLIRKCALDGNPISNLQLQKILYYIQAEFLQKKNKALFSDEIEAWTFGPVVRDVYMRYCGYGSTEIYETDEPNVSFSDDEIAVMNNIVADKRNIKVWELVNATHEQGKPWDRIYRGGLGNKEIIPKAVIAKYA
ncbi:hypothetical protein TAMA11512_21500 [Selenomonas sp. TAMA-11512]|uniref:Panacea domain-containing protein n=1 Tax=Selenomonas sp. TAMA-11512 TaxID=3095337 RepID=UPI0030936D0A|nr:hypothetical protein TAMA11512_21500 [Selenomonas sp. TAMA-11512]